MNGIVGVPRAFLLTLLLRMEAAIPPPPKCHHVLSVTMYGSDAAGWEPKLALQVNVGGEFFAYFLDEGDTVDEIVELVMKHQQTMAAEGPGSAQLGVGPGQFV